MTTDLAIGTIIDPTAEVSLVSYGNDKSLFVEFYMREVENEQKSREAGRPIYESKPYVRILAPGDKTKNWDRPVRFKPFGGEPSDLARFPRQWMAFQNQEKQEIAEGTPIMEWAAITRSDAMSLKAINIHTVEQLAALGDHNLTWMGARSLRDKAKAWLESAKGNAASLQWAKEKADMQAQITALQNQMNGFRAASPQPQNQEPLNYATSGYVQQVGPTLPVQPTQEASAPPVKTAKKKRGPKKKVKNEQNVSSTNAASGR